jgi:hypothetical protein
VRVTPGQIKFAASFIMKHGAAGSRPGTFLEAYNAGRITFALSGYFSADLREKSAEMPAKTPKSFPLPGAIFYF